RPIGELSQRETLAGSKHEQPLDFTTTLLALDHGAKRGVGTARIEMGLAEQLRAGGRARQRDLWGEEARQEAEDRKEWPAGSHTSILRHRIALETISPRRSRSYMTRRCY